MDERVKEGRGEDHTSLELEKTTAAADEGASDNIFITYENPHIHTHTHTHTRARARALVCG